MILPFLDTCSGPGIDPNWATILGSDSFRQDAGVYKGDNEGAGFYTGSRQITLVGEVAGSIEADMTAVATAPLTPASFDVFSGGPFGTAILAAIQWWSQGLSAMIIANANPGFTEVELRLLVYSNTNSTIYEELLDSSIQPSAAFNLRIVRDGADYKFYKDDVLIHTASLEDTSDSVDPSVALGDGGTLDLFGTLDNIEILAYAASPPPAAPVLLSPADGSINIFTKPTLEWAAVIGAVTYDLEVATDFAFTNIVHSASGLTSTTYEVPDPIALGTLHYWRVRALN